jgi:hypothetical protein
MASELFRRAVWAPVPVSKVRRGMPALSINMPPMPCDYSSMLHSHAQYPLAVGITVGRGNSISVVLPAASFSVPAIGPANVI